MISTFWCKVVTFFLSYFISKETEWNACYMYVCGIRKNYYYFSERLHSNLLQLNNFAVFFFIIENVTTCDEERKKKKKRVTDKRCK